MTALPDLFDEAVADAPPSRLTAMDVLTAARLRRRHRATVSASLVITVALATLATANVVGRHSPNPPTGAAPPAPLVWAGRADADHLYKVENICGANPLTDPSAVGSDDGYSTDSPAPSGQRADPSPMIGPNCNRLLASSDGGATWSARADMQTPEVIILGPRTLLQYAPRAAVTPTRGEGHPSYSDQFELTTDAGVTWRPLPADGPQIDAVPVGGRVLGVSPMLGIIVFDPAENRVRFLSGAPVRNALEITTSQDGSLWMSGADPATGRPAVAVSHDRGRSWSLRVLPDTRPMLDQSQLHNGEAPTSYQMTDWLESVRSWDGRTAYVIMYDHDARGVSAPPALQGMGGCPASPAPGPETSCWAWMRGFVTHDGGVTWTELGTGPVIPSHEWSWVTADGRLVLEVSPPPGSGQGPTAGPSPEPLETYVTTTDAMSYTVAAPPGLPHQPYFVDGHIAYTDRAVYLSDDGWTWHRA